MWAVGFGVLGAFFAIWGIAAASIGMEQANLIINVGSVVQCVVFGAYGLKWQQTHLESSGFVFKDTVTAANAQGRNRAVHEEELRKSKQQTIEIRVATSYDSRADCRSPATLATVSATQFKGC